MRGMRAILVAAALVVALAAPATAGMMRQMPQGEQAGGMGSGMMGGMMGHGMMGPGPSPAPGMRGPGGPPAQQHRH